MHYTFTHKLILCFVVRFFYLSFLIDSIVFGVQTKIYRKKRNKLYFGNKFIYECALKTFCSAFYSLVQEPHTHRFNWIFFNDYFVHTKLNKSEREPKIYYTPSLTHTHFVDSTRPFLYLYIKYIT